MQNFLEETIEAIKNLDKTPEDIVWMGSCDGYFSWAEFVEIANFEYDNGYGGAEIATDLVIVFKDCYLSRGEYDGSEWWEAHKTPKKPKLKLALKILSGIQLEDDYGSSWSSLKELNT